MNCQMSVFIYRRLEMKDSHHVLATATGFDYTDPFLGNSSSAEQVIFSLVASRRSSPTTQETSLVFPVKKDQRVLLGFP